MFTNTLWDLSRTPRLGGYLQVTSPCIVISCLKQLAVSVLNVFCFYQDVWANHVYNNKTRTYYPWILVMSQIGSFVLSVGSG